MKETLLGDNGRVWGKLQQVSLQLQDTGISFTFELVLLVSHLFPTKTITRGRGSGMPSLLPIWATTVRLECGD